MRTESELNIEEICTFLIRKKNNAILGGIKILENIYICESQFNIKSPFSVTFEEKRTCSCFIIFNYMKG